MIDFPSKKRHFNVLFIYTVPAHLPLHRLRPVLLFGVYIDFSEIATFLSMVVVNTNLPEIDRHSPKLLDIVQ